MWPRGPLKSKTSPAGRSSMANASCTLLGHRARRCLGETSPTSRRVQGEAAAFVFSRAFEYTFVLNKLFFSTCLLDAVEEGEGEEEEEEGGEEEEAA